MSVEFYTTKRANSVQTGLKPCESPHNLLFSDMNGEKLICHLTSYMYDLVTPTALH